MGWALVMLITLSLQSVTILIILEFFPLLKASPHAVATIGFVALGGLALLALLGFRLCGCRISLWSTFFAVVTWSAAIDLVLALALVDKTNLGRFYMETGEEYFKSSWGFGALLWDGTAHYVIQLYLAFATLFDRPRRVAGLLWAGSIINSMPVLLLGAATGAFSSTIKPSTALNAPYVAVPIIYVANLLSLPEKQSKQAKKSQRSTTPNPLDATNAFKVCAWATLHAIAVILHVWRGAVALSCQAPLAESWRLTFDPVLADPARPSYGFARLQCLVYFFYYAPFHAWTAYNLVVKKSPLASMSDASIFVAGGYAQAQATYLGCVLFEWVSFGPLAANDGVKTEAVMLGLLLLFFPFAFSLHCYIDSRKSKR